MSELEIPNLPWFSVKEVIQRLREMEMLVWICYLRPTSPPREGPGDIFTASPHPRQFIYELLTPGTSEVDLVWKLDPYRGNQVSMRSLG